MYLYGCKCLSIRPLLVDYNGQNYITCNRIMMVLDVNMFPFAVCTVQLWYYQVKKTGRSVEE